MASPEVGNGNRLARLQAGLASNIYPLVLILKNVYTVYNYQKLMNIHIMNPFIMTIYSLISNSGSTSINSCWPRRSSRPSSPPWRLAARPFSAMASEKQKSSSSDNHLYLLEYIGMVIIST